MIRIKKYSQLLFLLPFSISLASNIFGQTDDFFTKDPLVTYDEKSNFQNYIIAIPGYKLDPL